MVELEWSWEVWGTSLSTSVQPLKATDEVREKLGASGGRGVEGMLGPREWTTGLDGLEDTTSTLGGIEGGG